MFILVTALAAVAQTTAAVPAQKDDPVICRRQTSEVGTHMQPKKICLRRSDWDLVEKNATREMQSLNDHHLDPGKAEGHRPND